MSITYKFFNSTSDGAFVSVEKFIDGKPEWAIPLDEQNRHYQMYLEDIKTHGMSIVTCTDCGDGIPNDSMWQYLDNAEQLVIDKYGSDPSLHDKMTALREDRYVRAMEAKIPYESMNDAGSVIENTPQEIKDKYRHLPMRR